jgi:pyruvate/2-oxoglutarate dehydrogenase complex dihydrolipoamide acyltransferase (E2) component
MARRVHIKMVADRTGADLAVEVPADALVADIKVAVHAQHVLRPPVATQKLVYAGRLLADTDRLTTVLEREDPTHVPTFHLLCTPTPTLFASTPPVASSSSAAATVVEAPAPTPATAPAPAAAAAPAPTGTPAVIPAVAARPAAVPYVVLNGVAYAVLPLDGSSHAWLTTTTATIAPEPADPAPAPAPVLAPAPAPMADGDGDAAAPRTWGAILSLIVRLVFFGPCVRVGCGCACVLTDRTVLPLFSSPFSPVALLTRGADMHRIMLVSGVAVGYFL